MGLWKTIKSFFASGGSAPPDVPRLKAGNESELSVSLRALPDGDRGWITLSEARHLFSRMEDQYAFGEMDVRRADRHQFLDLQITRAPWRNSIGSVGYTNNALSKAALQIS
jgi:hypothetical protein